MSKADKLRELQQRINLLEWKNANLEKKLEEWQKRAKPQLSDFIKSP